MTSLSAQHAERRLLQEGDDRMSSLTAEEATALANSDDPLSVASAIRFFLQMSSDLEKHGNLPESIKCSESALLLRCAKGQIVEELLEPLIEKGICMRTVAEDAGNLVLRCNNYAVNAFNEKRFAVAEFFLGKALFLTDHRSLDDVNYFPTAETRRRLLRASTLNNLGCMEKRRGRLEQSLSYLRQAVALEVSLDATSGGSPSTYLNLCTVLNEMSRHHEAVSAAESAITSLEQQMLQQRKEQLPGCATMLVVGLYNLGVSLEWRGREGDGEKANASYHRALETSRRFFVDPNCPTVELAMAAIRRIHRVPVFRADRAEKILPPKKMLEDVAEAQQSEPGTAFPVAAASNSVSGTIRDSQSLSGHSAPTLRQQKHQEEEEQKKSQELPASSTEKVLPKVTRLMPLGEKVSSTNSSEQNPNPHGAPLFSSPIRPLASFQEAMVTGSGARRSGPFLSSSAFSTPIVPDAALSSRERSAAESVRGAGASRASGSMNISVKDGSSTSQRQSSLNIYPLQRRSIGVAPGAVGSYEDVRRSSGRPPALAPIGQMLPQSPTSTDGVKFLGFGMQRASLSNISNAPISPRNAPKKGGRRAFGSGSLQEALESSAPQNMQRLNMSASLALEKHVQRTQIRQVKKEEAKKKLNAYDPKATALARKKEQEKRMAKEEAERDAALADAMYHKFVHGMRAEELNRCRRASVLIQRIWRGCLARILLRKMVVAAKKIQRVFRVFLVKLLAVRRRENERLARAKAAREKLETGAAIVLQAHVRNFLRRLEIRRGYFARKMRRHYAARTIQRGFRAFLKWREEHIAVLMEAQRLEEERMMQLAINAARRIQWAFSRYLRRKEEIRASQEQERRERAAATIQAQMRGVLARAWFRYYKSYRREQELKSAVNQRRIIMLQSAFSVLLAVRHRRVKEVDLMRRVHQHQLHRAALKIQCRWRTRVAWIKLERLRAEHEMRNRRASRIQRWYATCVARREFLAIREANCRQNAVMVIQRWYHNQKEQIKERETARYYADIVRQQRLRLLQEQSALLLQAWGRGFISTLLVASMRFSFLRFTLYAEDLQRIGRGYAARNKMCRMKFQAIREAGLRVLHLRQMAAACVLQRAWRCAMAKETVERMRRREVASTSIAKHYRGYVCRKELRHLREERELAKKTAAAITLQRGVRHFLQRLELVRLDKYYRDRHRKKLVGMRREEAVTTLQAAWRGRATRMALERERKSLAALSVFVVKIQRSWRRRNFRRSIDMEVTRRMSTRLVHARAALVIQCFWRKMKAAEDVACLREAHRIRREKALRIQCWWRCILARRVFASLLAQREEELALRLYYMGKWDSMVTLINAELRVRLAQQHLLSQKRKHLIAQLTDRERERFLGRCTAASKIQAVYRRYYERIYARTIRQQREEAECQRQEREALEKRSAIIIQCAYRRWRAIHEVKMRHATKRAKKLEEEIEYSIRADPHNLVRELFWVHQSLLEHDVFKDRVQRSKKRHEAALTIQKAVRRWAAKQRVNKMRRKDLETRMAMTIQRQWNWYCSRKQRKELEKQHRAATIIQRRFRGYSTRQEWNEWRKCAAWEKQKHLLEDDIKDRATTMLQSFWRIIMAKRTAERLREQQAVKKEINKFAEAATLIQKNYRRHRLLRAMGSSTKM